MDKHCAVYQCRVNSERSKIRGLYVQEQENKGTEFSVVMIDASKPLIDPAGLRSARWPPNAWIVWVNF
jgi:hypothetical protein